MLRKKDPQAAAIDAKARQREKFMTTSGFWDDRGARYYTGNNGS